MLISTLIRKTKRIVSDNHLESGNLNGFFFHFHDQKYCEFSNLKNKVKHMNS